MKPSRSSVLFLGFTLLLPATAGATMDDGRPGKQDVQHLTSITFSPLHLSMPVLEVTAERRFHDKIGAGVILGGGTVTATDSAGNSVGSGFTVVEGGATFRYYPVGSFVHGMQLGAEAAYLKVLEKTEGDVSVSGSGLAVGPFVGYKIAANVGFTFEAQLGAQYIAASAEESGSETASASRSAWKPLLNLNLGWSF